MKKINELLKGCQGRGFFCDGIVSEKNRKRDLIITLIVMAVLGGFLAESHFYGRGKNKQLRMEKVATEQVASNEALQNSAEQDVAAIEKNIDTSQWSEHSDSLFGFAIKYPKEWRAPFVQNPLYGSNWMRRVQFRRNIIGLDNSYIGFDVVVYDANRVKEVMNTQDFPALKPGAIKEIGSCPAISAYITKAANYPAEEIYIPITDRCYEPALFFTLANNGYIYNVVPRKKVGLDILENPKAELLVEMPDFFTGAVTLKNIDVVKKTTVTAPIAKNANTVIPRSVVRKKVITGPGPVSYKRDSAGRRVCAKSNDHPGKSDQHKGKHMDMECCLDPDEYPNPHCYYDPGKYGKYLK